MKFTLNWLKDYLDTNYSIKEICETLTNIGLEVEQVIDRSTSLKGIKIAKIIETSQHPDADKLKICQVDTGKEILQIVCGGKNARAGIKVALATQGIIIPANNLKIKKSKIRGVDSFGMLCSGPELLINDDNFGILELEDNASLGEEVSSYLGLDDPVIEIAITPNRGDCLGVYGIARDLAAAGIGKLKEIEIPKINFQKNNTNIHIENHNNCSYFSIIEINNVKNLDSPRWMYNRLKAVGLNPINALVDISNYISYSFARPLHVYDKDKINGKITIRLAKKDERFIALNDKEYITIGEETVITDEEKIIGFAGIIGEKETGCTNKTTNVLLEVALFDSVNIASTGRMHNINTDARYRFERNVDQGFVETAQNITTSLILQICGGTVCQLLQDGNLIFTERKLSFDYSLLEKRIGIKLSNNIVKDILFKLGFKITKEYPDKLEIAIPSWRSDITIGEDIVEEILRINGYDKIPTKQLPSNNVQHQTILNFYQQIKIRVRRLLTTFGYNEIYSWSFMSSNDARYFADLNSSLEILNPISSELDYMRPTILANLINSVRKNSYRGFKNLSFFELGPVFYSNEPGDQEFVLTGIRTGKIDDKNIYNENRNFDVFDVKSDVLCCIEESGFNPENIQITQQTDKKYFHPNKSATLKIGKNIIGYFGEIHPLILKNFDINNSIVAFELFIDRLPAARSKKGRKPAPCFSDYQSVIRDFAFVVDKDLPVNDIIKSIINTEKNLIREVNIFDIYSGDNIDSNKKSVALSVKFQSNEKTLSDEEIENLGNKIILQITNSFKAKLR